MTTTSRLVTLLRCVLVLVFGALVLTQVGAVPRILPDITAPTTEQAAMRWVMLVVMVLALAAVQVVLVCTWRLLTMVRDDRIFSATSLPWVTAIVRAYAGGWLMLGGAFVCSYYFVVDEVGDNPALPGLLGLMLLVGAALGLLVLVMRSLLQQATTLRTDMDAVI